METAEIWVVPHFGNNQAGKNFLPQININKHRKACISVHLRSSMALSKQTETLLRFEFCLLLAGCLLLPDSKLPMHSTMIKWFI